MNIKPFITKAVLPSYTEQRDTTANRVTWWLSILFIIVMGAIVIWG